MDHETGEMKRLDGCYQLAREHHLPIITVEQLVQYLDRRDAELKSTLEDTVCVVAECTVPIERGGAYLGEWQMIVYSGPKHDQPHTHVIALVKGGVKAGTSVLGRIHSEVETHTHQ